MLYVIEKAKPYTRVKRGKLEHVKGYAGLSAPGKFVEKPVGQMVKENWNEKLQGISYERASELEGHDSPRISSAYFHFDRLTSQEQENTIQAYREEFKEAKKYQKDVLKDTGKTYAEVRKRKEEGKSIGGDKSMILPSILDKRRQAKRAVDRAKSIISDLSNRQEGLKKSGDATCPYDNLNGVQLRRFKQGAFWIREFKCPRGHVWQRTQ
jgi:hypothetical protein